MGTSMASNTKPECQISSQDDDKGEAGAEGDGEGGKMKERRRCRVGGYAALVIARVSYKYAESMVLSLLVIRSI